MPDGKTVSPRADSVAVGHAMDYSNQLQPSETNSTSMATPERESNVSSVNQTLTNGSKAQTGKEWVVHDEPGVYITLSSLPSGGNELKRVRFRYVIVIHVRM